MTPSLGLPRRGRVYALMATAVAVLLTLSVALPLVFGKVPPRSSGGTVALSLPTPSPQAGPLATPSPSLGVAAQPGSSPSALAVPGAAQPGPGAGSPTTVVPAPLSSGLGGRPAPAGVARTASDQGVTPTTLTVGVFIIDFGGANGLGAGVTGYDAPTQKKFAQAYRDAVNAAGGIDGRRLVLSERTVDILNQQTMRDACTAFGESDHVFAVLQVLGVYGDPILKCAKDEQLPFLATDGAVASYYPAAGGYLFTSQPSTRRTILTMEHRLIGLGELRGKKVGLLDEDGYLKPDFDALEAALRGDGISPVRADLSSSDSTTALRDIPTTAANFCQQGVDYVLLLVNELYGSQFVDNVDRTPGCAPAYAVSDFDFALAGDSFLKNMPNSFFRHGLAITASRHGEGRVGIAESAGDAQCRSTYQAQTQETLDRNNAANGDYFDVISVCQLVRNLVVGVERAGVNPTRSGFIQALAAIGGFDNAGYGPSHFSPGHTDAAGDAVRVTQAFGNCKCWMPISGFAAP